MSCPIKVNSNTIKLTMNTSCYWILDLLCVMTLCIKVEVKQTLFFIYLLGPSYLTSELQASFFIFLLVSHLRLSQKLQASFVMWGSASWIRGSDPAI